ncbi:DUF397 domain-containing protein [Streptomyces sp. 5-6(2022)]|uniref:DUF397 domain-containing protein n=1 Tax=Streptomyces sp. 5-6(2022) TaxID=2936510 RepID=UPI0023B96F80|nr:DUF397 domain-containing protein [Streptomyces sp. 5-6(2022)]
MISELDGSIWHKSSYSGNDNGCVEHGILPTGHQAVRDTKDRERGALLFEPSAWQVFVDAVRDGEFGG